MITTNLTETATLEQVITIFQEETLLKRPGTDSTGKVTKSSSIYEKSVSKSGHAKSSIGRMFKVLIKEMEDLLSK